MSFKFPQFKFFGLAKRCRVHVNIEGSYAIHQQRKSHRADVVSDNLTKKKVEAKHMDRVPNYFYCNNISRDSWCINFYFLVYDSWRVYLLPTLMIKK